MALPHIDLPTYTMKLPSSGRELKFRPYNVKERKILLMALESKEEQVIIDAIKQIITNCIVEHHEWDVGDLPDFDMEYLFIQLRARSIGEVITLNYDCKNPTANGLCNTAISTEFNLNDVKVRGVGDVSKVIALGGNVGLEMRYPTFDSAMNRGQSPTESAMDYIVRSIENIFEDDSVTATKDVPVAELQEFVESLTVENFAKIEKFLDNLPRIREEIDLKCGKCGYQHKIELEGLQSFFG